MLLTLNLSCAFAQIPNVRPCVEIPFVDGSEGACVETVTRKRTLISHQDWIKQRPYMLMISSKDWTEIKKTWLKACRGDSGCKEKLQSIDDVIQAIDGMVKNLDPLSK